jgi:pimeloyl-ACP methyl ester carboxylesterase
VLRDAVRHFCVDNDRVFLFGAGDGGSMAMDVGASHPDLFAGVLAMGAEPRWQNMFINYWQNAQALPFYVVTGEFAGEAPKHLRHIYEQWTRYGFPGIMVVYKGRAMEWYGAEIPVMFDWMARKKRAPAKATLKLDTKRRFPWVTQRPTDNHFYWIGVDEINPQRDIENLKAGTISPARINADIGGNNVINVESLGVRRFSLWLTDDMIDWTKPIAINVNRKAVPEWRGKMLTRDLGVLLEDYRERGDRRMLFLQRIELTGPQ